ncbi:MAG: glycosyltransferase, partial [Thermoleophilia bacterium]|nr:glycosyltransferase [Thermoleophilia bacterium]
RGGEDTVVDAEVAALRERGHDVELHEAHNVDPGERAGGSRLTVARRAVWSRDAAEAVARHAREFRPDVAHVHNHAYELSASIFPALAASGAAVVQTLHNYRMTCSNAYLLRDDRPCEDCVGSRAAWHGIQHRCFRGSLSGSTMLAAMQLAWRRGALQSVDRFIVLTEFAREIFERVGVPSDRLVVRPNTIPDPGFTSAERDADAPLLFVGRLERAKGIDVLLDAWRDDDPRLLVAGSGPLQSELQPGAGVTMLGAQSAEQVRELMAQARALVVPSTWYEGFPMVILEAMAAGTPIVASDLGSLAEIVRDPELGWRVPAGDAAALRDVLLRVAADPAESERRGAAARAAYEHDYVQPVVMDQLEQLYADAIAARSAC